MKKFVLTIFLAFTLLAGISLACDASTLDSVDLYLKYSAITRPLQSEQSAPTSITDAGEERINTSSGGVSYYSEDLNLPGKNGLDLVIGRKFNSDNNNHIKGDTQYIGLSSRFETGSPSESEKYVFAYHLTEDCTDEPIYVVFNTIWHMLDAEAEPGQITVESDYAASSINLRRTQNTYDWSIDIDHAVGLTFDDNIHVYNNIIGSDITLYRDMSKEYGILYSLTSTNNTFVRDDGYHRYINLGGGWEYDIPTVMSFTSGDYEGEDCYYGMLYDAYYKEAVSFVIAFSGTTVTHKQCYISSISGGRYQIEAGLNKSLVATYTITRSDGVKFRCVDDELRSVTDRFGNTIQYTYAADKSITITDTLGREILLTKNGISVDDEAIVSYSFDEYNDDARDPNQYYDEDNYASFTVTKKVLSNTTKQIVYNHSQRGRVFYFNGPMQTVGYSKMVLDSILLPTGAQRFYSYASIDKYTYAIYQTQKDYACVERYDLAVDSTTFENHQVYEYSLSSIDRFVITEITFPDREGFSITKTHNEDGLVTKSITECTDADYTLTESYTYQTVGASSRVKRESSSKTTSGDAASTCVTEYEYSNITHQLTKITRDDTVIYRAEYGTNAIPTYEFNFNKGIINTISNGSIVKKTYATIDSMTDDVDSADKHEDVTYTYDEYGNIASIDGDGGYREYTYEYGDYSTSAPTYSIIVTETYPSVDNITTSQGVDIPSADISTVSYYDKWGNLVKYKDGEGNITTYTYDYLGRPLTITNPDNTTVIYSYNDIINRIYITDENGKRTSIRYDSLGREFAYYYLSEDKKMWKLVYHNNYDNNSNLIRHSIYYGGGVDCIISYEYYSDNSIKSETLTQGNNQEVLSQNLYTYAVPSKNKSTTTITRKKTDTEDVVFTIYTNQYGHRIKDTITYGADEYVQSYTVNGSGYVTEVTDFKGNEARRYSYDYRMRPTMEYRPVGYTKNVYNNEFLYQVIDGKGIVIKTYEYNTRGQLIEEITPIDDDTDNITHYYYDRNGNKTKTVTTTGDGTQVKTTTTIYDSRNRAVAVDDGSGYYTRYEYNNIGNITRMATGVPTATEVLDRATHSVTDYEYSFRDFHIKTTDPMGYTESYTYNSRGTMISMTDKNGTVIDYTYDGQPKLLSKTATGTDGSTQSISYTYDYLGNLTQMVDENGSTVYTYDGLGNVLTEQRGTIVKEYGYDLNGNRTSAHITDGTFNYSLTYEYDANNRLTKVTNGSRYATYTYDDNDRPLYTHAYNSSSLSALCAHTVYSYYDSGLLKTKRNSTSSGVSYETYTLSYYADGNIASVSDNDGVTAYSYDSAGRLISESFDGVTQASYTYDARGNRATMTTADSVTTYTYGKDNRLFNAITQGEGIYRYHYYGYDNNGNMTEDYWGGQADELFDISYDLFGRMKRVNHANSTLVASYTYDGNGIRLSKTTADGTTRFINDGANVVVETSGDSTIRYIYGNELICINNNGSIGYYHTDEHGNVAEITNTDREVVASYGFDAFGNQIATNDYYNPMRYCGEYYDAETNLTYLRARYYDPSVGRFTSVDPIKDGTNWYVYCGNNPVMFVDPSGLEEVLRVLKDTGTVENDKAILNGEGLIYIDRLKQLYNLAYEYENTYVMDAIHNEAVEVRQNRYYHRKDIDEALHRTYSPTGYIDTYKYVNTDFLDVVHIDGLDCGYVYTSIANTGTWFMSEGQEIVSGIAEIGLAVLTKSGTYVDVGQYMQVANAGLFITDHFTGEKTYLSCNDFIITIDVDKGLLDWGETIKFIYHDGDNSSYKTINEHGLSKNYQ